MSGFQNGLALKSLMYYSVFKKNTYSCIDKGFSVPHLPAEIFKALEKT